MLQEAPLRVTYPLTLKHFRMFQMMSGAGGPETWYDGMGVGGGMNPMMAGMAVVGDFAGGAGGMRPGMNMGMGAGMGNKGLGRAMIGGGGVNPNIPRGPRDGPGPLGWVVLVPGVLMGPQWMAKRTTQFPSLYPVIFACSSKKPTCFPLSRKGAIACL